MSLVYVAKMCCQNMSRVVNLHPNVVCFSILFYILLRVHDPCIGGMAAWRWMLNVGASICVLLLMSGMCGSRVLMCHLFLSIQKIRDHWVTKLCLNSYYKIEVSDGWSLYQGCLRSCCLCFCLHPFRIGKDGRLPWYVLSMRRSGRMWLIVRSPHNEQRLWKCIFVSSTFICTIIVMWSLMFHSQRQGGLQMKLSRRQHIVFGFHFRRKLGVSLCCSVTHWTESRNTQRSIMMTIVHVTILNAGMQTFGRRIGVPT